LRRGHVDEIGQKVCEGGDHGGEVE
jgi:hypothetical protein